MSETKRTPMLTTYKMQERIDTISARDEITPYMQGELGILNAFVDDVERLEKEWQSMFKLLEKFARDANYVTLERDWHLLRPKIMEAK